MSKKMLIKSEEERLVYGEVYRPLDIDSQGDAMTASAIKAMAHAFLSKGLTGNIDESHDRVITGCKVVESFLARKNDPDEFAEGSWVLGVKVNADDKWALVKSGDLNGFSFSGTAESIPVKVNAEVPDTGTGETEKSADGPLPPHTHTLSMQFKDGSVLPGETDEVLGHSHLYKSVSATEKSFDHSHRIILELEAENAS
jgi:hypothetical protein